MIAHNILPITEVNQFGDIQCPHCKTWFITPYDACLVPAMDACMRCQKLFSLSAEIALEANRRRDGMEDCPDLLHCSLCPERRFARAPVPGEGNVRLAKICLLGRNPGRNEDAEGRPFIGRAGRRLDVGLILARIVRNTCWVTNVSKCMTPKDVTPSVDCRRICVKKWLMGELESLEKLGIIVTLGNEALWVFEPLGRVGMLHGTSFPYTLPWGRKVTIFVSYHPAAALRSSETDKHFTNDMIRLGKLLENAKTSDVRGIQE